MKIAVDTQALFSPVFKGRGIANYLYNQLDTMFRQDTSKEYILFNLYSEESVLDAYFAGANHPNVREFRLYTGVDQFLIQARNENGKPLYRDLLKGIVEKFLRENEIDVFFYASPFDHWNYFEKEWFAGVRTVATVYDIIPYVMQDVYLQDPAAKAEYMRKIELLRGFDRILAISQSVKEDLVRHLSFAPEQVGVVYAGISSFYKMGVVPEEEAAQVRQKYGITGEFIFVAGGCDPRKNMPETLQAYAKLPPELVEQYQLVFVCKMLGGYPDMLREAARQAGLAPDRVVLTDFVPDNDLLALYRMARLTAFASKYEGFGLPIIESMACGTPVVTSDNSSLGEVAKGAAVLVNPFDIDSIAEGLYKALTEERAKYAAEMREKVDTFTWDNSGELTLKNMPGVPAGERTGTQQPQAGRFALFAPLPPQESGIADYTASLLRATAPEIGVDVFVDDGYKPAEDLPPHVCVYNHTEYPQKHKEYAGTLYQMGNSHLYHYYMLPYIRQFGGTVELHDVNLHNMLQHKTVDIEGDLETYERYLTEDYANARELVEEMRQTRISPSPENLPLNGVITRYADKLIVHSQYARTMLLQMDVARSARVIPLFALEAPPQSKVDARTSLGIAKDAFVFATFGAVSETRRIEPLLKAFAEGDFTRTLLYITGGFASEKLEGSIKSLVAELGLQNRVLFTGRLEEKALEAYIAACDACVNLRWPYHGETSGILARVLQAGKPAIVTDVGSFGELPEDICVKVGAPTDGFDETGAILSALQKLRNDKDLATSLGKNAAQYAHKHWEPKMLARKIWAYTAKDGVEQPVTEASLRAVAKEILRNAGGRERYEILKISESLGYLL